MEMTVKDKYSTYLFYLSELSFSDTINPRKLV